MKTVRWACLALVAALACARADDPAKRVLPPSDVEPVPDPDGPPDVITADVITEGPLDFGPLRNFWIMFGRPVAFCDLVKAPAQFRGGIVRFRGTVGRAYPLVVTGECGGSVLVAYPQTDRQIPGLSRLKALLKVRKSVNAMFEGRVVTTPLSGGPTFGVILHAVYE